MKCSMYEMSSLYKISKCPFNKMSKCPMNEMSKFPMNEMSKCQ